MRHARTNVAVAAALLAMVPAGEGFGQAGKDQPADSAKYELEDLVVTAHRVPVPRDRVASRVAVVSGEELRARGIHFLSGALRDLAGATLVEGGSYGSLTSLFLRGGESDYVRVLVDGIPVNEPGGSFDFANLTTDNLERIELLRGPGSVLYGSDAMTGVLQLFTRRGRGAPRLEAGFRGGTLGTRQWNGALSGSTETAGYSFEVSRFSSDGVFETNNDFRNAAASGRVHITPDSRTEAAATLRYTDSEFRFPTDGAGRPVDENQVQRRDDITLGLEVGRSLAPGWEARLRLGVDATNLGFEDRPDGPADTLGLFAFHSEEDVDRWILDARVGYRLGPATVFTLGGEVSGESFRNLNRSEGQFGESGGEVEASRTNRGVYAQAVADLVGGLSVTAGARLDDNERFGAFDTYRAGAVYRFPSGTRIRGSWGLGFKEPTFLEQFSEGFARGNPDLEPEASRSWELGLDQDLLDERLRLALTYFDQGFRNLIQFTFAPPSEGGPNFFNVAEAEARGLEVELTAGLPLGAWAEAHYTRLETETTDPGFQEGPGAAFAEGRRLLRRPADSAGLRIGGPFVSALSAWLEVRRVGPREDLDFSDIAPRRIVLPAHTTVNLALSGPALTAGGIVGLSPTLRVENLFDEVYEEVANFPARGRTVLVGGRVSLGGRAR